MFLPSSDEPPIHETEIVAFCTALNTPVVNIEDLDVGPARAAILLSADSSRGLSLLVRVSLISLPQGVTFRFQEDPALFGTHERAVEAALGFAEGMGFLFDLDLIESGGPSGRARALRIWSSLIDSSSSQTDLNAPNSDAPELELTDDLILEDEVVESPSTPDAAMVVGKASGANTETASFAAQGPPTDSGAAVGSPVLTKFRGARVAEDVSRPNSVELARTTLMSEEVASEVVDDTGFLTRLLSSF